MRRTGTFVIGGMFILTIGLVLLGVIMVLSSSQFIFSRNPNLNVYAYMGRQLMYFSIGLASLSFFALYDYNKWESKSRMLMIFSIVLLVLVLTPVGHLNNGARRWIRIAGFGFQPSDILKISAIMYLSSVWADRREELASFFKGVFFPMSFVGIGLALLLLEPDHGTTIFIGLVAMTIWFTAGGRLKHIVPCILIFAVLIVVALKMKPNLYKRIDAYLNPAAYPAESYQVEQAKRSFALGGMWGAGIGEGVNQLGFVPEVHTDFILATMGEELGFVKCALVFSGYLMLLIFGYWTAMRCNNPFGSLLAVGCTTAIGVQAALNIAVVTGSIPNTGIALPFISYGGSSLTVSMTMVGLIISVARDAFMTEHSRRTAR